MQETWKHVWGFSRYMVSDMGRVKSRETGLLVSQDLGKDGQYTVVLTDNHNYKFVKRVGRLVIDSFCWSAEGYSQLLYIDGDKTNNKLSNLTRMDEPLEKRKHVRRDSSYVGMDDEGTLRPANYEPPVKEEVRDDNPQKRARGYRQQKGRVRVIETGQEYASVAEMSRALNLDHSTVSKMLRGVGRQKTHRNLTFEFVQNTADRSTFNEFKGHRSRRIRVIETGDVYPSQKECAKVLDLNQSAISAVLRGRNKQHKGLTFEYVDAEGA